MGDASARSILDLVSSVMMLQEVQVMQQAEAGVEEPALQVLIPVDSGWTEAALNQVCKCTGVPMATLHSPLQRIAISLKVVETSGSK